MTKRFHPAVFDHGLSVLLEDTTAVALVKNYAADDTFATVTGNVLAAYEVAVAGDLTLQNLTGGGSGREVAVAAQSGVTAVATSAPGDDLHFALLDSALERVLAVTDETTNQVVTSGNLVNLPALRFYFEQPA